MRIVKEPIPPDQQDVQRRPDVALIEDNQTTYIDFAIAEPAASSFQTGPNSSLNTPGGAAIQKEEQKRLHYADLGLKKTLFIIFNQEKSITQFFLLVTTHYLTSLA